MTLPSFALILLAVALNGVAQLLLKAGTQALNSLGLAGTTATLAAAAFQPFILLGLACYVVSFAVWILALGKVPVSIAYPMLSIGYVFNAVAAFYLFGEALTLPKLLGLGLILVGVVVLARS